MKRWMTLCDKYAQEIKRMNAEDNRGASPPRLNASSFAAPEDISAISSGSMPIIPVELLRERPEVQGVILSIKQAVQGGMPLEQEFKSHDPEGTTKILRSTF